MSSKQTARKSDDTRKVRSEFAEHMRREYFSNHVFRGTTLILTNNGRTYMIAVPNERDW